MFVELSLTGRVAEYRLRMHDTLEVIPVRSTDHPLSVFVLPPTDNKPRS